MHPVTRCLIQNICPLRRPATAITERECLREIIHRRKLLLPLLRTHRACINIRMMRKEQRIHARGARLMVRGRPPACLPFQSTRPCGARPRAAADTFYSHRFNPRAPCGARPRRSKAERCGVSFQSTRPVWGATDTLLNLLCQAFQSTRPVWGATSLSS